MLDRIRKTFISLPLGPDTLTTGTAKAIWPVPAGFIGRVLSAALCLRTTGATSGATTVDVNKAPGGSSPATILATPLSIAFGAAVKSVQAKVAGGTGEPSGVTVNGNKGDTIEVDVDAIPGTASTGALVILEVAVTDV